MKKLLTKLILTAILSLASITTLAQNITIFAAASLTNVLQQISEEYKKQMPDDTLTFSFAASSTLAKQIERDAPADLFISADPKWMDYIAEKQPNNVKNITAFAENTLVLISPKNSGLKIDTLADIHFTSVIGNSYLAVGDDNVPVGRYAKKALENLNLWNEVKHRLAKGKDTRTVLSYIEREELPLGIVYATDAKISNKVQVVATFPKSSYGQIVYLAATLNDKAKPFLAYLSSPTAKDLLEQAGFSLIHSTE